MCVSRQEENYAQSQLLSLAPAAYPRDAFQSKEPGRSPRSIRMSVVELTAQGCVSLDAAGRPDGTIIKPEEPNYAPSEVMSCRHLTARRGKRLILALIGGPCQSCDAAIAMPVILSR